MLVILSDPDPELAEGGGESKNPLSSWGNGSFGFVLRTSLRMTEGLRILRRAAARLAQDDGGRTEVRSFACHSERSIEDA